MWMLLACADPVPLAEGPGRPRDSEAAPDSDGADSDSGDSGDDTEAVPLDYSRAPGCGDDELGGFEECDGASDDACPGACSAACQCPSAPAEGRLQLHVVDVGQGDGLLLVSPAGFVTLVDAGDDDAWPDLQARLDAVGIPGLDHVVASHQHVDHMGAMDRALFDHPEIGLAWDNGGRADSSDFENYVELAGDRRVAVAAGEALDLGEGLEVEVVHAGIGDTENENNNSVVLRVRHGDVRLLLGGDCEFLVCEQGFDPGPIDVYKVHHHGSDDSTGPGFLDAMRPSLALISAGRGNDYGHPHQGTLDALAAVGAEVWRTDEDGSILVESDGSSWTVEAEAR